MRILKENLNTIKNKNQDLFNKLKRSCYVKGYMKYACNVNTHVYDAYVLLSDDKKLLSWMLACNVKDNERLIMIWTPIRLRGKGYAKFLLLEIAKDYGVNNISCYSQACGLMYSVFGDSYKCSYKSINSSTPDKAIFDYSILQKNNQIS